MIHDMKLKIITLNVWHGGRLWDETIEFLKHEDPDILLMQEVFNHHDPSLEPRFRTMDEFNKIFEFVDSDFAPSCMFVEDFGKVESGLAIFTKLPIVKRYEPIFFNEPFNDNYVDDENGPPTAPRNLQHIVIDVHDISLDVLNLQGVWDLDGENDSQRRLHMSQIIVDAIKDKQNVVLGGDTNVRPNTQTIRNIEKHLNNVFGHELKTTFNVSRKDNPKLKAGYAESVVDMFFVSPHLRVVDHYCPDVDVSDHLPLVITLDI
ncbi:MAG: endonuclease/exonuclease/phosphatase family protein [Candidatus Saccharimonadales bacterium]